MTIIAGVAFGGETGDDHGGAGAQVGGGDGRAGQVRLAFYHGDAVFHADMRAKARKLGGVHEPVFKDGFKKYACARRLAGDGHHGRLQIGRKTRIDHRTDLEGLLCAGGQHQGALDDQGSANIDLGDLLEIFDGIIINDLNGVEISAVIQNDKTKLLAGALIAYPTADLDGLIGILRCVFVQLTDRNQFHMKKHLL